MMVSKKLKCFQNKIGPLQYVQNNVGFSRFYEIRFIFVLRYDGIICLQKDYNVDFLRPAHSG